MKRISLVLILVAAALIRLLHLHSIWDTPLVTTPIIDSEFYHFWAKALATGQGGDSSVFFMSPLYPYLLSVIYRIFAVDPHYVLMVQFLGGILLVYLIYSLARELFSEKIALTSALIAALYQPFIYYEGVLLSANLILLLNAAFLLILVRKQEMGWLNLFAGILMGLSALARPNILLFAFLLIVYLIFNLKNTNWRKLVLITCGLLLVLLPVGIRNYIVGGEFVLVTAGTGMNFYAGNSPHAEGIYWEAPFLRSAEPQYENDDYRQEAARRTGTPMTVGEASKYWFGEGIQFIKSHPLSYLQLLLRKLFLFFHSTEIPNNLSLYINLIFSSVLRLVPFTFGLIVPLGLFFWLRRYHSSIPVILHIYGLSYLAATLLFFAASEYRLPVVVVLIPLTAAGFWWFVDHIRAAEWEKLAGPLLIALLLALAINMPTVFTNVIKSPRMDYFNLGSVLLKKHDFATAAGMFNRAILIDLDFKEAHRGLGDAFHGLEQYENAADEFKRAGLDPDAEIAYLDAENLFYEAEMKARFGDFYGAWNDYNAGIAGHPGPPLHVYYNIAFMSLQLGDTLRALDEVRIALNYAPTEPKILFLQGWIYEQQGMYKEALASFKIAMEQNPSLPEARAHAAFVCLQLGDKLRAAELIEPLVGRKFDDADMNQLVRDVAAEAGF
ncbi:tetratricopeptide repeat protein [bacterium]|nr:tetratricopeptide repeat protein [bacterium]MBU1651033.1 tetratricopeptide repeat protein [bacterium]